jgi:hypothetical protein
MKLRKILNGCSAWKRISSFRGVSETSEPGIQNRCTMCLDFRVCAEAAHPGMTNRLTRYSMIA